MLSHTRFDSASENIQATAGGASENLALYDNSNMKEYQKTVLRNSDDGGLLHYVCGGGGDLQRDATPIDNKLPELPAEYQPELKEPRLSEVQLSEENRDELFNALNSIWIDYNELKGGQLSKQDLVRRTNQEMERMPFNVTLTLGDSRCANTQVDFPGGSNYNSIVLSKTHGLLVLGTQQGRPVWVPLKTVLDHAAKLDGRKV